MIPPAIQSPARRAGRIAGRSGIVVLAVILTCAAFPGPWTGTATAATPASGPTAAPDSVTPPVAPPARVLLDRLTPEILRPGSELAVTGRVQNTGTSVLREPSVRLLFSSLPVLSRGQLAALASGEQVREGRAVEESRTDLPDLAPGRTGRFTLRISVADLGLGGFGVYPLAVEARGGTDVGFGRVAVTQTFLPWAPSPGQVRPTRLAWLWPLVDRPHRDGNGVFVDDTLATEIGPGGRLARLLAAGRGRRVTWVVDPMLLEDASAMTDGYAVARRGGGNAPGRGGLTARAFLDRLAGEVAGDEVVALPYGDPDVAAARRGKLAATVRAAARLRQDLASAVLRRPVTTDVALPPGGWLDGPTADLLRDTGVDAVVLRSGSLPLAESLSFTPTGRATVALADGSLLDAALLDDRLSELAAADTGSAGTAVLARQRFLAETAMISAERPSDGRAVAVAPPARWGPGATAAALLAVSERAPWIEPVRLADLLATPVPAVRRGALTYPAAAAAAELPAGHVSAVRRIGRDLATLDELLNDPDEGEAGDSRLLARLLSAGLRGDESSRRRLLERTRRGLSATLGGVRLLPTSVQLSSREQSFPVTVVNDLDREVTVGVALSVDNPRLTVGATEPVTVAAGGKRQVLVPAQAVANGLVTVRAALRTSAGTPFGSPALIQVRVAQIGLAALLVTLGAALLLFAAAARNVVRRLRGRQPTPERAGGPPAHPPTATGPPSVPARGRHVG